MSDVIKFDAKYLKVAQAYLRGDSISEISSTFNLSENDVSDFLNRKEVRSYIASSLQQVGYANPMKRIELLSSIVDKKVQDAEEQDLPYTKADLLEVIKLLQAEQKLLDGAKVENTPVINIQTEYANFINSIQGK